jgi:hypothetical protein
MMSAGLKGDIGKIRALEKWLKRRDLPLVVAAQVATRVAGTITALARQTFKAGQNAYGDPWLPGADGKPVDLVRTGALAAALAYVATGTKLRARLGPAYAKYQIGLRPVFPTGKLPRAYVDAIHADAIAVIQAELRRAA